jgi:hypothetical protein
VALFRILGLLYIYLYLLYLALGFDFNAGIIYNRIRKMEPLAKYKEKLEDLTKSAKNIADKQASKQLLKMLDSCWHLLTEINREAVTCRRIKRDTLDFINLKFKLDQYITDIEYWLTIAQLTY